MIMTALQTLYEFRPINHENLDAVRILHDELLPIRYTDSFYKSLLNGAYKTLLLYESDSSQLVGVSTWKIEHREQKINGTEQCKQVQVGYLATFGIRSSFRRKGLGKYLLLSTLSMMQDLRCALSELHVLSTNHAAKNLYLHCGFQIKLFLPNHYHFNDQTHDAFLLLKSLQSAANNNANAEDTEYTESTQDLEESKSVHDDIRSGDNDGMTRSQWMERSPPYYDSDVNVEVSVPPSITMQHEEIMNIKTDTSVWPLSNWIEFHVQSLWIKCTIFNNLMFPVEDRANKSLMFKCKHCGAKITVRQNQKEYCVYQNYVNQDEETNIDAVVNPDVIMDPTLPRTRDVECSKCHHHEAVFFSAQSKNPDEAMSLIFVCTNAECKAFWKR